MWGVIDDSIHPGWDVAPRLLPGKPADAHAARHLKERPAGLPDSTMAPPALPGQEADATITREFSPAWDAGDAGHADTQ
jgi:hypothetical protein